mmetsp:Transcript_22142/g.61254  ORF Transcript_22142/g.61254 Transcript_22142/m.61254 type:complete len:117 (-) Transcript_22142:656-1006(-)
MSATSASPSMATALIILSFSDSSSHGPYLGTKVVDPGAVPSPSSILSEMSWADIPWFSICDTVGMLDRFCSSLSKVSSEQNGKIDIRKPPADLTWASRLRDTPKPSAVLVCSLSTK